MYGLGFTNVTNTGGGTTSAIGTALNAAGAAVGVPGVGELFTTIANALHIGAGRNEADRIVPTQNVFGDFLARVSAYIPIAPNVQSLTQLANNLSQAWVGFQRFVSDRNAFPDGRASRQALNDLTPLVEGFQTGIARRIAELGGGDLMSRIVQGLGGPSLEVPTYGESNIPQAGMLPYYPPNYTNPLQTGFLSEGNVIPFVIAGAAAWLLFGRKSR